MNDRILIKLGETFLKGKNRGIFESAIIENIKEKISPLGNFDIKNNNSVILISGNDVEILSPHIKKIFGIALFSFACRAEKDMNEIKMAAIEIMRLKFDARTFKVEAKRADKTFLVESPEICNEVGEFILENLPLKVDVINPDVILKIEVRSDGVFLSTDSIHGAGGLPCGTSGKGAVMISGGIDSPVAAWMMAKRGLKLVFVHFAMPPYTSTRAEIKVKKLVDRISEYSGKNKVFFVNITKIQEAIRKNCAEEFFTVISRRFMGRISEKIAFCEGCRCVITGESLGQVASQTLGGLECTNAVFTLPVFRPLIGTDKCEIIKIAREIGTFGISIEPFEDCCAIFSPKNPKIRPKIKFVEMDERKIKNSEELIEEALTNLRF
jgi:thiamine biosynthesis protein ThiI